MVGKRQCCHCDPSTFQAQQLPLIWSHWPFCDTWTLQGTCLPWNNHMVFCWARSFPADQPGEFLPSKRTCSGSLIWDFSVKPLSYSPCSPAQSSPAVPLILSDLLPLLLSPASIWNNSPFCNLFCLSLLEFCSRWYILPLLGFILGWVRELGTMANV